jgi:hypothetical protein
VPGGKVALGFVVHQKEDQAQEYCHQDHENYGCGHAPSQPTLQDILVRRFQVSGIEGPVKLAALTGGPPEKLTGTQSAFKTPEFSREHAGAGSSIP